MVSNYLKASGIIAIVFGSIFILTIFGAFIGIPTLIGGIILLTYSSLQGWELEKKKDAILGWSIVFIFLCWIAAIFSFIAYSKITSSNTIISNNKDPGNNNVKPVKVIDPKEVERKRLDLILQLGIAMVMLSVIIFVSTNWQFMYDSFKVISLLLVGVAFIGVCQFVDKKLHVKAMTITYWLLGNFFLWFAYISIGSLQIFGEWFSFIGMGSELFVSIMFLVLAGLLYISKVRFNKPIILYYIIPSLTVSFISVIYFLHIEAILYVSLLLIYGYGKIKKSKSIFNKISKVAFIVISSFYFINNFYIIESGFSIEILSSLVGLFLIVMISYYDTLKNKAYELVPVLLAGIGGTSFIILLELSPSMEIIVITLMCAIIYMSSYFFKNKKLIYFSSLISNSILGLLLFSSFVVEPIVPIIVASVLLLINIVENDIIKRNIVVDKYLQPIKVSAVIIALIYFVNEVIVNITVDDIFWLVGLVLLGISLIAKNIKFKVIYIYISISFVFLLLMYINAHVLVNSVLNTTQYTNVIALMVSLIILGCHLYFNNSIKEKSIIILKEPLFVLLIIMSGYLFNAFGYVYDNVVVFNLLYFIMLFVILFNTYKNKLFNSITMIAFVISFISFINILGLASYLEMLIISLVLVIMLIYICFYIVNKIVLRNIFFAVGLSLIYLSIIFSDNLVLGIYIGISGLAYIIYSLYNKNYASLFVIGVVITITNLVIQLISFWEMIPWWIYILTVGLILIGVVSYKLSRPEFADKKEKIIDKNKELFDIPQYTIIKMLIYIIVLLIFMVK